MPQILLRQPGLTFNACEPFTETKERIQNELDKACFQIWLANMSYGDFKDLPRTTASDKLLRDKEFDIDKNPKYDDYNWGLASMVCKSFDKKASGSGVKKEIIFSQELAEELLKPIITKIGKRKVDDLYFTYKYTQSISFEDNIWVLILSICN